MNAQKTIVVAVNTPQILDIKERRRRQRKASLVLLGVEQTEIAKALKLDVSVVNKTISGACINRRVVEYVYDSYGIDLEG